MNSFVRLDFCKPEKAGMKININNPDKKSVKRISAVIRKGGVVLYPTDTVYGLGCDPFNISSLEKIFRLKGRAPEKGVLLLIPSGDWLSRIATVINPENIKLCNAWWPGPVTCLFRAGPDLPDLLTGSEGKIGIRLPDNRFLLDCMEAIPGPLVSTSANPAGKPAPADFAEIDPQILNGVDLCIENTAAAIAGKKPSTVVDLSGDEPLVVRRGEGLNLVAESGIRIE